MPQMLQYMEENRKSQLHQALSFPIHENQHRYGTKCLIFLSLHLGGGKQCTKFAKHLLYVIGRWFKSECFYRALGKFWKLYILFMLQRQI